MRSSRIATIVTVLAVWTTWALADDDRRPHLAEAQSFLKNLRWDQVEEHCLDAAKAISYNPRNAPEAKDIMSRGL